MLIVRKAADGFVVNGNFFSRLDMSVAKVCKKVLSATTNAELDDIFSSSD